MFPTSAIQNDKNDTNVSKCVAAEFILRTFMPQLTTLTFTETFLALCCFSCNICCRALA